MARGPSSIASLPSQFEEEKLSKLLCHILRLQSHLCNISQQSQHSLCPFNKELHLQFMQYFLVLNSQELIYLIVILLIYFDIRCKRKECVRVCRKVVVMKRKEDQFLHTPCCVILCYVVLCCVMLCCVVMKRKGDQF